MGENKGAFIRIDDYGDDDDEIINGHLTNSGTDKCADLVGLIFKLARLQ